MLSVTDFLFLLVSMPHYIRERFHGSDDQLDLEELRLLRWIIHIPSPAEHHRAHQCSRQPYQQASPIQHLLCHIDGIARLSKTM